MNTDIKKLLNKKGWTGREVGRAVLMSITDAYKQSLLGNPDPKPLFSQAQLNKMVRSITDSREGQYYNRHLGVQNWLMQYQAVANAYLQQAQGIINSLVSVIATATTAENELIYIEQLPCIMTQKQYDDYRAQRIEEQLRGPDGDDSIGFDVFSLLLELLSFYRDQLHKEPRKANPLKAVRKEYQQREVTSAYILDHYNEAMCNGYYTLPDGRRSDQMTDEEWREAVSPSAARKAVEEALEAGYAIEGLDESITGQTLATLDEKRILNRQKLIFNGATDKEADEIQSKQDEKLGLNLPCEWHIYPGRPEGLTKWDIIEDGEIWELFPALNRADISDEEYMEEAAAFREEFPALVEALLSDLDKLLGAPADGKSFKELPLSEWRYTVYLWRELYRIDFPGFRAGIEDDGVIFDGNYRANANGIAILQPSQHLRFRGGIDENGYYVEPECGRFSTVLGLESFTPANEEEYIERMEDIERKRHTLEDCIYILKGYDCIIEMLAEYLDIPDFRIFKAGITASLDRIDALNGMIAMLHGRIRDTHYTDEEAKQRKLQVLKDLFYHFRGREIELEPEAVKAARDEIFSELKGFEANDGHLIGLFTPPVREEA